jgi:serine/threonine protein phosphatase PrpC
VGGNLAVTRAFGDFEFKLLIEDGKIERKNFITSEPEIRRHDINPFQDEFIIIGSDGLFDKFTSQ